MDLAAWLVEKPEGPFKKIELSSAPLKEKHVRIRIAAAGVNPLDTKIRAGKAAHAKQPLPAILGLDMAGTVEEVGAGITAFRKGDEVYGMVGGVGGLQGTFAQTIDVDADLLAHKPKNLSMREAAALPLAVITSWEALIDHAKLCEGESVLIHAGAGGVGHIAVQIALAHGARVFATVSERKKEIVEDFGATAIDYRAASVEEYVDAHTEGKGFDIIFDTVGGATLDDSFLAVKRYSGRVVSALGWGTHSLAPLSFRAATYSGVFTLMPLLTGEGREHHGWILGQAAELILAGKLKPMLNQKKFSPANADAAYAQVESGSLGKVVIEM